MIRVHLGRDGQNNSSGGSSKQSKLLSQLSLNHPNNAKLNKQLARVGGVSTVALAMAIAFLPHLFIDEYKKLVIKQKEAEIKLAEGQLQEVTAQAAQMEPFRRELESFDQQKKNVRERLDVVRRLQADRATPVNLLDAVGQSLPPQAWLESLVYTEGKEVKVSGLALTNDAVSDFSQRLAESIYVGDATINDVGSANVEHVAVRQFSLNIRGKGVAKPEPTKGSPPLGAPPAAKPAKGEVE